jgi:two-component system cell cycle sensor histidine kinase/response regulator CckA
MSRQHEAIFKGRFAESIAFKFLKTLTLILFFSALVLSAAIAGNQWKLNERSLVDKGSGLASYISKISRDPLIHGDSLQLDAIVNDANKDDDILYTIIRGAEGNLLTSKYASINYRSPRVASALANLPRTQDLQEIITAVKKEEAVREISMPIFIDIKTIGTITIGLSMYKIRHEAARTVALVLSLNLLAAIALGIVLFVFSRKILLAPITTLADAAARLAKGDLSTQVTLRSTGEVKLLIDSFNRMAEDLKKTTVSRNYMNNIFRSMIDTLVIVSPDGTIRGCNAAICALLGYEENDLIGKPLETVIAKEAAGGGPVIAEVREKGAIHNRELEYAGRDGRAVPMLFSASPMYDESGRFEGVVCVAQDITDRKRAEEALRLSEEMFKILSDQSPLGKALIDGQGRYEYVNPAFVAIFGYTLQDLPTGAEWFRTAFPDAAQRKEVVRVWKEDLARIGTGESRPRIFDVVCKGGACKTILFRPVALQGSRQLVIYEDITEGRRMESQLQQAMKMEAVGRLAGGVAHDFNNILTVITGYSELLLQKVGKGSPMHRELEEIKRAGDRAAALTRQLLAFSRKQIIEPKVVRLDRLMAEVLAMLSRLIGENIAIQTITGISPGSVKIDPGQFQQILMNLVVNARDAMPGGGKIVIETANVDLDEGYCALHPYVTPGRFVMLAVSDTGQGMSEEVKAHIFEPFFTTKEKGSGTGLGLATTYGAVKQSGGSIEVYSEIGIGTTFKIYLPRVEEEAIKPANDDRPTDLPGGTETVLLVEDEDIVRNLGVRILGDLGYRIMQARNGAEALALAMGYKERIDLLLTDVVMPGMNGSELATQVVPLHPEMKVLFTSGYTDDAIVDHGVLHEGVSFIGKPFSPERLARKVREVLGMA